MGETIGRILSFSIGQFTLGRLLWAAAVLALCLSATKAALKLLGKALEKSTVEQTLRAFIRSAVKAVLLFLSVIITLGILEIPVTSLVALFSVAGVAVSLAIQGALSNLTSGVELLSARPFKAGDYVDAGGVSGTASEIGLVHTKLTTIDNKIIFVPNATITSNVIVNYSANETRRIDFRIGASYQAPTATVKDALLRAAARIRHVETPAPPFAALDSYGESAIVYLLRLWVKTEQYWDEYYKLNEYVREEFDAAGVSIPYGQLDVHLVGSCGPQPPAVEETESPQES